jgi:RNA polymerase sigma-70 factor (ECF subfamily)
MSAFDVQGDVRGPWRRFLDALEDQRPALHRYCCRLTGNVWDGEDLLQDALLNVFGALGKIDRDLENPAAYLARTATHLWIDRQRRSARERAWIADVAAAAADASDATADASHERPERALEARQALGTLATWPPRERAAVLLCDVLDFTSAEAGAMLQISAGAVKAALHRARERLASADSATASPAAPPRALVEAFLAALAARDLDALQRLCADDLVVELVGGATSYGFDASRTFFAHAHWEPGPEMAALARAMRMGTRPNWRLANYDGEWLVLGLRTYDGLEGLNEIHRLEAIDDRIARIRCYCFSPDTLRHVAERLGMRALARPYRSPDPPRR